MVGVADQDGLAGTGGRLLHQKSNAVREGLRGHGPSPPTIHRKYFASSKALQNLHGLLQRLIGEQRHGNLPLVQLVEHPRDALIRDACDG